MPQIPGSWIEAMDEAYDETDELVQNIPVSYVCLFVKQDHLPERFIEFLRGQDNAGPQDANCKRDIQSGTSPDGNLALAMRGAGDPFGAIFVMQRIGDRSAGGSFGSAFVV